MTAPVIPDSPPPYSEIDPASAQNESTKISLTRPTSLELGASSENPDEGIGTENLIPEEGSSTREEEEDTANAVLGNFSVFE